MNIAFLLIPKKKIDFLFDDFTIRQSMEKMKVHGYTMVPVIERSTGKYLRSVSDGDFLKVLIDRRLDFHDLETLPLGLVPSGREIKSVSIYATMEELMVLIRRQNYVPVVDDFGAFIGIVTRQSILENYHPSEN